MHYKLDSIVFHMSSSLYSSTEISIDFMIVHEQNNTEVQKVILDYVTTRPTTFRPATFTFVGIPTNLMEYSGETLLYLQPLLDVCSL